MIGQEIETSRPAWATRKTLSLKKEKKIMKTESRMAVASIGGDRVRGTSYRSMGTGFTFARR